MSVSRRRFFKGLVAGLGSLGLANVILSKQGWLGFLQPAKAHAHIPGSPGPTYTLRPQFQFFQGDIDRPPQHPVRDGADDPPTPRAIGRWNDFAPVAQIIEYNSANPNSQRSIVRVYNLRIPEMFVTRLLLMGVDTNTLSEMYASRFGVTAAAALTAITGFINNNNWFQRHNYTNPGLPATAALVPTPPPAGGTIWADFSMGSVYAVKAIKYP